MLLPSSHGSTSARQLWQNKPAQLAIWSYSFHSWELLGMWAWLPAFLVAAAAYGGDTSAGPLAIGVGIAGLTHLASVIGSIAGGTLSDRIGRTRVILLMSVASLVCSFSFGWMLGAPLWIITLVAMVYNLTAIGDSSVFSTVLSETVPPSQIGFAFSIRSVVGFGMGAISPWVFGLVLDWASGAGGSGPKRLGARVVFDRSGRIARSTADVAVAQDFLDNSAAEAIRAIPMARHKQTLRSERLLYHSLLWFAAKTFGNGHN